MLILRLLLFVVGVAKAFREEEIFDPNDPTKSFVHVGGQQNCHLHDEIMRDSTLRYIVRQMMDRLYIQLPAQGDVIRSAKIRLTRKDLEELHNYLEYTDIAEELSGRERVQWALENMFELDEDSHESVIEELLRMCAPYIMFANALLLPIALFILIRSILSSRALWPTLFGVAFLLSWITAYSRLYKEELARRIAESSELQSSSVCEPPSLFVSLLEAIGRRTVYIHNKSQCQRFIESQTIPAFFVISPVDALTDVVANTLFGFIANTAQHFNKFFRNFYHDLPIFVQAIMTVFLFLLIGRIRTPLFSYEPILFTAIGDMWGSALRLIGHRQEAVEAPHRAEPTASIPALRDTFKTKALPSANNQSDSSLIRASRAEQRSRSSPSRCGISKCDELDRFDNVTPRSRERKQRMRAEKLYVENMEEELENRSRSSSVHRLRRDSSSEN